MRAPAPRPQVLHVRCGHSRRAHRLCTSDAGARAAPTRTSTAQGAGTAQARSGVKRPRSRRPAAKRQLKARAPRRCSAHLAGPACGRRSRRAARPRILRFHRRCAARRAIRAGARRRRRGVVDRRPCARPRAGRGHGAWARVCSGGRAGDQRDAHAHAGAALHTERDADRPLAARGRRGRGPGGGGAPARPARRRGPRPPRSPRPPLRALGRRARPLPAAPRPGGRARRHRPCLAGAQPGPPCLPAGRRLRSEGCPHMRTQAYNSLSSTVRQGQHHAKQRAINLGGLAKPPAGMPSTAGRPSERAAAGAAPRSLSRKRS